MNELMDKADILMVTETGSTKKDTTWTCHDEYEIVKENKAEHDKKGVIVCGKGTMMATRRNIVT
mgnify:CR=1 FL=1